MHVSNKKQVILIFFPFTASLYLTRRSRTFSPSHFAHTHLPWACLIASPGFQCCSPSFQKAGATPHFWGICQAQFTVVPRLSAGHLGKITSLTHFSRECLSYTLILQSPSFLSQSVLGHPRYALTQWRDELRDFIDNRTTMLRANACFCNYISKINTFYGILQGQE